MEKEIEEEIARLSDELGGALRRITSLELERREEPLLSPAGPPVEQRALKLLQYIEKHGRITSRQAKKILQCHPSGVHRAMKLVAERFEGVNIRKQNTGSLRGSLILESEYALRTLRSGAQAELRKELQIH